MKKSLGRGSKVFTAVRQSVVELMEQRRLLSAGIVLQPNGTLVVTGTTGADSISVQFTPDSPGAGATVSVDSQTGTFDWAAVKSVVINSLDGNDSISVFGSLDGAPDFPPVSVVAGNGSDTINETLDGDYSSDYAQASVSISAGNGNDTFNLNGSSDNATIVAGNGNDQFATNIYGLGSLNASITAGNGNNTLTAGTTGAAGEQVVKYSAGIGQNYIYNGDVDDHISGTLGGSSYSLTWNQEQILGNEYADINGNGSYDLGEPQVANVPVSFQNSYVGSFGATTSSSGSYLVQVPYDADSGTINTFDANSSFTLQPGELISGVDFALKQPLGGAVVGTVGSYNNDGNTASKAFDGNLNTFFDAPTANGDYAGRNLGTKTIITAIAYAPRAGYASRMVGGIFQGSNSPNFSSPVTLYTITSAPAAGVLTYQSINNATAFQYVRYLAPNGGYGNAAEVQFFTTPPTPSGAVLGSNGLLTVTGTSGADSIQVKINLNAPGDGPETVTTILNNNTQVFNALNVKGIVINSGDGNDTITTQGNYEVLYGNPEFDPTADLATTINCGNGNDTVNAFVSADASTYESPTDHVYLGSGTDQVTIDQDDDSYVYGGAGNDTVNGNATDGGGLYFYGGSGNNTFEGGGYTTDFFYGGSGTNTYIEGPDYGVANLDVNLNGPYLNNVQNYINHNQVDTITVEATSSTREIILDGGDSYVTVTGGSGNEYIAVTAQSAQITTGNGNNTVYISTPQPSTVTGGSGNDVFDAIDSTGPVTINGGGGTNTAYTNPNDIVSNIQVLNPSYTSPFSGTLLATSGSYQNDGNTAAKAFDGNLSTYFDGPTGNGDYVGLDLGAYHMIGSIAYAPRSGWASRMVGGTFQVSNSSDFSQAANLFTIAATPPVGQFSVVTFSTPLFARYIRYVAPDGSFGNVAEIQIRPPAPTGPTKLGGTIIGTPGSYRNHGTTIANVFDGNFTTYFDAPDASGDWVGEDLGSAKIVTQVDFAPRSGWESRMVGGQIQASNSANFSSGVVTLYTITKAPPAGVFTVQPLSNATAYRYYRYIGPTNSYCDIAELEFDG